VILDSVYSKIAVKHVYLQMVASTLFKFHLLKSLSTNCSCGIFSVLICILIIDQYLHCSIFQGFTFLLHFLFQFEQYCCYCGSSV